MVERPSGILSNYSRLTRLLVGIRAEAIYVNNGVHYPNGISNSVVLQRGVVSRTGQTRDLQSNFLNRTRIARGCYNQSSDNAENAHVQPTIFVRRSGHLAQEK